MSSKNGSARTHKNLTENASTVKCKIVHKSRDCRAKQSQNQNKMSNTDNILIAIACNTELKYGIGSMVS